MELKRNRRYWNPWNKPATKPNLSKLFLLIVKNQQTIQSTQCAKNNIIFEIIKKDIAIYKYTYISLYLVKSLLLIIKIWDLCEIYSHNYNLTTKSFVILTRIYAKKACQIF